VSGHRKSDKQDGAQKGAVTPAWRPKQVQKTAPCQAGCANCGDVRGWIGLVAQRKKTGMSRSEAFAAAWRLIAEVNPFPATLGRICPHPCEDHCNRGEKDEPLAINALERFLGDHAIAAGLTLPGIEDRDGDGSVGVVGAGPSGLSFAYQMARRGYRVTVYDARDKPGGMLRYGVPDYRLPQDVLEAEIARIVDLGVNLQLNTRVGKDIALEELRERHEVLYLGLGAQQGRSLDIPGVEGPSVWTGVDYLNRLNCGETVDLGQRVVVVGGGNSAIDAARSARRMGSEVTIAYRRSQADMPAVAHEVEEAIEEGVGLMLNVTPVRIERTAGGRIECLWLQNMKPGKPDSSGRRSPVPVDGSEFSLPADSIVAAVSQVPSLKGFEALDHHGDWLVSSEYGAIDDQIWTGGDARGLGIAGEAIVQGRRAAERLHVRLRGGEEDVRFDPKVADALAPGVRFETKPAGVAAHSAHPGGEERLALGMREAASTIKESEFLAEVERCFSCGSCFGCEQCFMYCTSGCFTRVEEPRPGMYFSLNLEACRECGKCIEVCPCGFLES
jgi:formate dehydrogenase major subunit